VRRRVSAGLKPSIGRSSVADPVQQTRRTVRLNEADNVAIAIDDLPAGTSLPSGVLTRERIRRGHKVALSPLEAGMPILKFGQTIGFAGAAIAPGDWVHVHNVTLRSFDRDYSHAQAAREEEILPAHLQATFEGFRRPNGKVGTRNYLGILTSVNCSATTARFIADAVNSSGILSDYPNVDGVVPFVHGTGCAMAHQGEGFDVLMRTQWGYATHPNLGAALMVGLGCETFQIARMKEAYGIVEGEHFQSMTIQESGGTRRSIEQGVARIREMLPFVDHARRETVSAANLMLALQCGGSDGYSGLTANPALGAAVDLLVRHGGSAILSETPEIYGAEHLLTARAATPAIGEKLVDIIHWWEEHVARHGGDMDNNPSAGNKAGGLTTIVEKSLGAVAKGGTTTLRGVFRYAEQVDCKGLVFMDTPGFDPTSATGQVAGGANMLCFTTGRGSAYGCKPTPSIKLATNSDIYRRMQEDMDINCGDIVDGASVSDKGLEIFQAVLATASGNKSKSEQLGYGDNEFVPWQLGVVM